MWGFPYTTLAGALLMAALMISTAFTEFFRMTLWFGIPFTLLLAWLITSRAAERLRRCHSRCRRRNRGEG
ncbi:Uncharacterised protein [Serratia entomophila]|nr:Uncharacterised protein [Serratia entomophila]CAI1575160.1 Uncharacterised protein [Serratia entomophila]CAI1582597.1 Uncharacterised protein [Serratia entomophila]CAI2417090.1 Uncharacterised protein [Serratia entomophila]